MPALLRQAEQMRRTGRLQESEALCRRVLATDPRTAPAYQCLSLIAHQVGKPTQAAELMAKAVECAPQVSSYRRNLCEMYRRLKRLDEAIVQGREAVRLADNDAETFYNLGVALDNKGDLAGARDAFARAVTINPRHNLAWNNLGSTHSRLDDEDGALAAYLKAAKIDPRHAEAQNNIAAIYIDRGELDEARERLRLAIDARPDFLKAHQNLSTLTKYRADDPHYANLEEQLVKREALSPEQRMRMLFAVAKAREDVGHFALALIAYHEANRLKRTTIDYDEARAQRLCEALTAPFGAASFAAPETVTNADPSPVLIVGMPRSGTTLIEQVLCSHPRIHGAGELKDLHAVLQAHPQVGPMREAAAWAPLLTEAHYREIGQAYLERLRGYHATAARITDKMPGNFHYLGFLCRALPGAKIIHSMRDPMDSCLSNYTRLFNETMAFTYSLEELGRYYNRYIQVMKHWDRVLPEGVLLHMPYEAMVRDLPRHARRIIAHVGLEWDPACLKFYENRRPVRTASVAQVRQPIYSSSVARWQAYGDGLKPLHDIVGDSYPHGLLE